MRPLSVVIPAYNEEGSIAPTVTDLHRMFSESGIQGEILVVDDGSTDSTAALAERAGARLISHGTNRGYGASLKTGIRNALHDTIAIIDADGTYPVDRIPDLLEELEGCEMVVGARTGENVRIPAMRKPAKWVLRKVANRITGTNIPDLNSGLRIFTRELVKKYINLLPDGFSFTTTITVASLCNDTGVKFVPINYYTRQFLQDQTRPLPRLPGACSQAGCALQAPTNIPSCIGDPFPAGADQASPRPCDRNWSDRFQHRPFQLPHHFNHHGDLPHIKPAGHPCGNGSGGTGGQALAMCGFAGVLLERAEARNSSIDAALGEMSRVIIHRGPDDQGSIWNGPCGMVHRRLSVIDLSPAGRQPMCNESGTVWICYNGEVYNFPELRRRFSLDNDYHFRSRTDTEVILHLYEKLDKDFLKHLNGMFSLAIWDSNRNRLLLARDPFGVKPLFYMNHRGGLWFASEIKSLLQAPDSSPIPILKPFSTIWDSTMCPGPSPPSRASMNLHLEPR